MESNVDIDAASACTVITVRTQKTRGKAAGVQGVVVEYPIAEVARLAGTTSRTLRHYGEVGLLEPSRIGANGYRLYDAQP